MPIRKLSHNDSLIIHMGGYSLLMFKAIYQGKSQGNFYPISRDIGKYPGSQSLIEVKIHDERELNSAGKIGDQQANNHPL